MSGSCYVSKVNLCRHFNDKGFSVSSYVTARFENQKPSIITSAKVTEVQRLLKLRTFDEGHQVLIWWVVWNLVGVLCMQSATIQGFVV